MDDLKIYSVNSDRQIKKSYNSKGDTKMKRYLFLTAILVLFFSFAVNAFATTYYVATTGNNNNPGTEAQPWATLTYAENRLSSGDTLIVRGGTYNETLYINVANVTFQNYPSETPIIDGGGTLPTDGDTGSLITIAYTSGGITFDGFEVKNSNAIGITLKSIDSNTVKNCTIHGIDKTGIVVDTDADNTLIEDCVIYEHNLHWPQHRGLWGSGIVTVRNHDTTIRRCQVYNGYGEGIIAGRQSTNVIIEYCSVYDNRALQIYADNSKDVIIRYNLAYGTRNETYNTRYPGSTAGPGISIAVEVPTPGYGDGAEIYGNFVADCYHGLVIGNVTNTVAYNNTVVEAYVTDSTPLLFYVDNRLTDHIVKNNIFIQTNGTIADVPSGGTYANNFWSKTPEADAQGAGDVIGNPLLAKTSGWNSLVAGAVRGPGFALQSTSPAINAGILLGTEFKNIPDCDRCVWPTKVMLTDQDSQGSGWEIGADIHVENPTALDPPTNLKVAAGQ